MGPLQTLLPKSHSGNWTAAGDYQFPGEPNLVRNPRTGPSIDFVWYYSGSSASINTDWLNIKLLQRVPHSGMKRLFYKDLPKDDPRRYDWDGSKRIRKVNYKT